MAENGQEATESAAPTFHFKQLITTLVLVGGLLLVVALIFIQREMAFRKTAAGWASKRFGFTTPVTNRLAPEFTDDNQDLVADPPKDESKYVTPEVLHFCYIPAGGDESDQSVWQDFVAKLSTALGTRVEYYPVRNIEAQMAALKSGDLHITGINTGGVPRAVNVCGFVPVSAVASGNGTYGYQMQLIVPADSKVQEVEDLMGQRITFVNPNSNSGFKAPAVLLKQQYGMEIDVDYSYGFSTSHDNSIRGIKNGEFAAAAVASDILERMVAQGEISGSDYRVIYESERFPPACIGYVHNLAPEIAKRLREALLSYELADTELQKQLTADENASFAAVSYKDDWSVIRMIDDAQGIRHEVKVDEPAAETPDENAGATSGADGLPSENAQADVDESTDAEVLAAENEGAEADGSDNSAQSDQGAESPRMSLDTEPAGGGVD